MFIRKRFRGIILVKGKDDIYIPPTGQSSRWKYWMTELGPKVCSACEAMQEKIYSLYEQADPAPPLHPNCRCEIEVMKSVIAGFGTNIVLFGRMTA